MNTNSRFLGLWAGVLLMTAAAFSAPTEGIKLYWGNYRDTVYGGGIWRANPDGSDTELIVKGADDWQNPEEGETTTVQCMAIDATGERVYFGEVWPVNSMRRVNLDGSGVTNIFSSDRGLAVALDLTHGKLYGRYSAGGYEIRKSNLDGSEPETLFSGVTTAGGIALDVANDHMYWAESFSLTGTICRADLNGGSVTTLVQNIDVPRGIALDLVDGKMYWATHNDGTGESPWQRATVQRSNLDGTGVETLLKGQNSTVEAPMTAYLASPGDIVLHKAEGVFYVGGVRIIRAAMDGSGSTQITPDAGGVYNAYGLALYFPPPPPQGSVIAIR